MQGLEGGTADWRRKEWEAASSLQRLHDTARMLRARVSEPLFKAATSRPKEGVRNHGGADISSSDRDVKGTRRHQTGINFHRHPAIEFKISSSLVLAMPTTWSLTPLGLATLALSFNPGIRAGMSRLAALIGGRSSVARSTSLPPPSTRADKQASWGPCWRHRHAKGCRAIPHSACRQSRPARG